MPFAITDSPFARPEIIQLDHHILKPNRSRRLATVGWRLALAKLCLCTLLVTSEAVSAAAVPLCTSEYEMSQCPLGAANLSANSDATLSVSNIGSSGNDGVSIQFTPSVDWRSNWDDIGLAESFPNSSFLSLSGTGVYSSGTSLEILTHVQDIGSEVVVIPDFSAIGSNSYSINVLNDDTLVASFENLSGAAVKTIRFPLSFRLKKIREPDGLFGVRFRVDWRKKDKGTSIFQIGDIIAEGDELEFVPTLSDSSPELISITGATFLASDLSEFTFQDMSATAVPIPSSLLFMVSGLYVLTRRNRKQVH